MFRSLIILLALVLGCGCEAQAQVTVGGKVTDEDTKAPIEFASILINESGRWAITDKDGSFTMKDVPKGWATLTIQCLGYAKRQITIDVKGVGAEQSPEVWLHDNTHDLERIPASFADGKLVLKKSDRNSAAFLILF